MANYFLAAWTLAIREMVRFFRQPSRIFGAIGSPVIFWLLIGSGIGSSFRDSETGRADYLSYFFPGTLLLILFFTSIFTTISIIEDRREGFLQGVLVSPVPRSGIVLGKILGGTLLAFLQAMVFLALAPWTGIHMSPASFAAASAALFLNAFVLTSLGFMLAWQFHSIQGFHAVMNLFLMPMWIMSGALFPDSGASPWIQNIMRWNPLTYGLAMLRQTVLGDSSIPWPTALSVSLIFATVFFTLSTLSVLRPQAKNLR